MDSESLFNEIYQSLRQAGLLDVEIIMEIEARKYGMVFNKTQVGYSELLERCSVATPLTKIEASDGTYQRKLKKLRILINRLRISPFQRSQGRSSR